MFSKWSKAQWKAYKGLHRMGQDQLIGACTMHTTGDNDKITVGSKKVTIKGIEPEAEVILNKEGGKQSKAVCDLTLVPPEVLIEVAKVFTSGAEKYGHKNYLKISGNDHINHALVHVFAHLAGDRQEGEKGHLLHALCRLFMAVEVYK